MAANAIHKVCTVTRWGLDLAIRIPPEAVEQLELKAGALVKVRVRRDSITIRCAKDRRRWTEQELLKGITPALCGPNLIPGRAGMEIL